MGRLSDKQVHDVVRGRRWLVSKQIETNSQSQSKDALVAKKRPILLTIFCLIYWFIFVWLYINLLSPSYRDSLAKLPTWYVVTATGILNPLGIVSIFGVWFMRRWGLYLNLILTLLSWELIYSQAHVVPYFGAVLMVCIFWAVCFVHLNRMR